MILADVLSGLVETDTDLLLAINGWRAEWADYFMYAFSGKWIWVPLYAALLYVIVRNLHWKVAIGCAVAIALTIVLPTRWGNRYPSGSVQASSGESGESRFGVRADSQRL